MNIIESLNMIRRIENLPEIYEREDILVISELNAYYEELLSVELEEQALFQANNENREAFNALLKKKRLIHEKYWCNNEAFYRPSSASSDPDHEWDSLSSFEVFRNGDDDQPLFLVKAVHTDRGHGLKTTRVYEFKVIEGKARIQHEFFG